MTLTPETPTRAEDFSSIVLTIDHLAATPHVGGHQVHKFVCSTQSLIESMIALFDYYDLAHLLRDPGTHRMFGMSETGEGLPVFILHTADNTQVVTDADTWAVLVQGVGEGSMLKATEHLIDMVGKSLSDQIKTRGNASTLSLAMLTAETIDNSAAELNEPGAPEPEA
jgi:hypothetical protein